MAFWRVFWRRWRKLTKKSVPRFMLSVRRRVKVLNVGSDSFLFSFKPFSRMFFVDCSKSAVIVHFRNYEISEAKVACFKTHLGECNIAVDSFSFCF